MLLNGNSDWKDTNFDMEMKCIGKYWNAYSKITLCMKDFFSSADWNWKKSQDFELKTIAILKKIGKKKTYSQNGILAGFENYWTEY